jgi:glyoxylase-like metal-dependent hydrolase (beta-lactamase superfamily II)
LFALVAFGMPVFAEEPGGVSKLAPGVWFRRGETGLGYCNNTIIEMKDYLIVVDANYPGGARKVMAAIKELSSKPVRYVFDTHHHRDHTYGNSLWTAAGAITLAYQGVVDEMNRYEPARWLETASVRQDVRDLGLSDVERPKQTFRESPFVLKDETREVRFYFLGWAHTRGDGFVWLPKERILCTGDAAVNGPHNKLPDAYIANWPRVLEKALAFHPLYVLPGHGPAGGAEVLTGQMQFLMDLYAGVRRAVARGEKPGQIYLDLPASDRNWIPNSLQQDVEVTYREITEHQPAGALPHVWK